MTTRQTLQRLFIATTLAVATCASPVFGDETHGPNGEKMVPIGGLALTDAEIAKIKEGRYTAALLWHTSGDFINAVTAGVKDEFSRMGIEVIAVTDAAFDAAKQKNDVETVMAKKPNIILTLPLDAVAAAASFRPAVNAGVKLVFMSNVPNGYVHGKDYVGIVTDDLFQMGKHAADALAGAIENKGKVGYIFHDANYYVTNQRDQAFKATIEKDYPNIKIVAQQGIADPARAEDLAQAMLTKNPDLDGIYVTWAEPAEGVLSVLRNAGNKKTKIVTLDLSEPIALDMVKSGNVAAIIADKTYDAGVALADAAADGLLGKPVPIYSDVGVITITKSNIVEGYQVSVHHAPPQSVLDAAK
jgi:ribose transport system substrate-binding protein